MLRKTLSAAAACALAIGLTACGDDDDDESAEDVVVEDDTAEETTTTTEADDTDEDGDDGEDAEDADSGDGDRPEWATEFHTDGELLATIEADSFRVEVYQVGTGTAPKDGMFVDPDSNEPILKEGDEIVFVNYVFTNTSDAAIPLSHSLATVEATYADWQWLQGMDGITGDDLFAEHGLDSDALATGHDAPFVWEPGTSFAYAENFAYQPGGAITFEARMTPVDDAGELDHDRREEAAAEATIS